VCPAGPVPRSLLSSQALQYLDLSNNEFSGALPSLPPNMRLFNISANALDGVFPGARSSQGMEMRHRGKLVLCHDGICVGWGVLVQIGTNMRLFNISAECH
jgi:hypothetical protein